MTSFRRTYIDLLLNKCSHEFIGKLVLDIGGKKTNKAGSFRPESDATFVYLNIDRDSGPDYVASAESIPVDDESFDAFLLCEVLEHLEHPEAAVAEAYRILRFTGFGIVTIPFLHEFHGDPFDFQRFTGYKLEKLFRSVGFSRVEVQPQGGIFAVCHDLFLSLTWRATNKQRLSLFIRAIPRVLAMTRSVWWMLDNKFNWTSSHVTTGYQIRVWKEGKEVARQN